ncbi:MAG: glycosyltransferase family 39 protein [Chloroflexi bacterium]|nr:glycosyltransferase family 39 protein [Chloroflexota bacterium]
MKSYRHYFLLLAVLLLAFGLRVYRLEAQSLDADEINSMHTALGGIKEVFSPQILTRHPPLYFLFLHLWIKPAGTSEFAARYFSLFFSMLSIALIFALGRRLLSQSLGLMAAILTTFSALHIYYAQEARMYMLALFFTLFSVYLLIFLIRQPARLRLWLSWAVVAATAIASVYASLQIIAFEEIVLLWLLWRNRAWRPWLVTQGVLVIGLSPWLLYSQASSRVYGAVTPLTPLARPYPMLRDIALKFSLGPFLDSSLAQGAAAALLLLAALGLLYSLGRWRPRFFLAAYLVIPLALVIILASGRLDYAIRSVLVLLPAFLILLAAGLVWLRNRGRGWALLAGLIFIVPNAFSFHHYHFDPWSGREDLRDAARFLESQRQPNDLILFDAPWGNEFIDYYLTEPFHQAGLPDPLPLNPEATIAQLQGLVSQYPRIWLISWQTWFSDPTLFVESWLSKNSVTFTEGYFPYVTVKGYFTTPTLLTEVPTIEHPLVAELGGMVRLLGYDLDKGELASKGRLRLTLYWQSFKPLDKDYKVFVHFVDKDLRFYGQKDNRPLFDQFLTSQWPPGDILRDNYQIDLKPDTPPGEYWLLVGMYDPVTGQRLDIPALGQNYVPLDAIPFGGRARGH